ncbi:MAG: RimK-like ATPgrasp N-terminal domain-containing protein [candidate division Zixibacteria bacterium]|nr:RimK-like ATPgrasp N-terminal domain-containing protein [candidate division Zixibacteria bacterium]
MNKRRAKTSTAGNIAFDTGGPIVGLVQGEPGFVNLGGSYDYLSQAYYVSLDYDHEGKLIRPSCKQMLDAYVPPLFLEKATLAGLAVPEYYLSNGFFEPPVIVDPVNPFTLRGRIVLKPGRARSIAKSLTRNFTYAVCCQVLPEGSRVVFFRSILGWSHQPQFREISKAVWEVFGIPLARVRVIRTADNELLLSDLSPVFAEDLNVSEVKHLEERVTWEN